MIEPAVTPPIAPERRNGETHPLPRRAMGGRGRRLEGSRARSLGRPFEGRRVPEGGDSANEDATGRVTAGVGGRPPGATDQGEGAHPRPRRPGRPAPPDAEDGRGEELPLRGPERTREPARPLRGATPAGRLPSLLRARRHDLPGGRRRLSGASLR